MKKNNSILDNIEKIDIKKSQKQFIDNYKNNEIVISLKISNQEMLDNSSIIKKAIDNHNNCTSDKNFCPNGGFHYTLYRDENNQLKSKIIECNKIKNQNEFKKIINNYLLKEITVVDYNLKINDFNKYTPIIDKIKTNVLNKKNIYVHVKSDDVIDAISALTNNLCNDEKTVAFINVVDFSTYTITNPLEKIAVTLEKMKDVDLLVLNELGIEKFTRYLNINLIYSIINYRFVIKKPIIFISKYDIKELHKKYTMSTPSTQKKDIDNFIDKIIATTKDNITI